jgi:hypothetical protein
MKILDICSGVGGASMGIHLAGHSVTGLDIDPKQLEDYPFEKILGDALTCSLEGFDAYFASPPCQRYSYATTQWRNKGNEYPDLISQIRDRLLTTGKPFVLENVVGAPLRQDLLLCGQMFDKPEKRFTIRRHRIFEIHGFTVPQIEHIKHTGIVGDGRVLSIFGHGGGVRYNHCSSKLADWKEVMEMPWAKTRRQVTESIPPFYTRYIFEYLH